MRIVAIINCRMNAALAVKLVKSAAFFVRRQYGGYDHLQDRQGKRAVSDQVSQKTGKMRGLLDAQGVRHLQFVPKRILTVS